MKEPLRFSRSNVLFFFFVFLGWLGLIVLAPPQTSFGMGERMGLLLGMGLFPTFFAWIAWLISRRSAKAFSVTFNIFLGLMVLGQISTCSQNAQKTHAINELVSNKDELKKTLENDDFDVEAVDNAKAQHYAKVRQTFQDLADSTSGKESEFYQAMLRIAIETQNAETAWETSFNSVLDETILDFAVLNSKEEINRQTQVIQAYISESSEFRHFFIGSPDRIKKALEPFGPNYELATGALRGAKEKYDVQIPLMTPFLDAHIQYGEVMLEILALLDAELGSWSYQDDQVVFETDAGLNRFNQLVETMLSVEATINDLRQQIVQTM